MYEYNLALRFQEVASRRGDQPAIWLSHDNQLTYTELNQLANRIARLLIEHGAKKGDVICLSGEKSSNTFASMIASLKIGCTYAILDPDSPVERLRKILTTCRPRLLLGETEFTKRLAPVTSELTIETIDNLDTGSFDDNDLAETRSVTGSDPAYIMFTSGSTGFPKGAVMTHANVLNLIDWSQETFSITADDVLTNVNPLYFDNSVFDFYSSLFTGAGLVPFSKTEVGDPGLLIKKIDEATCTLWFSVPSLLLFLQTMKA